MPELLGWRRASAWGLVVGLAAGSAGTSPISAQPAAYLEPRPPRRLALVVGNSQYETLSKLPSAAHDASEVGRLLTEIGFEVAKHIDVATADQFQDEVLVPFRKRVQPDDLVVIYFSGHGFAYNGFNYIAPTKMKRELEPESVALNAIPIETIVSFFDAEGLGLVLAIVDACRSTGRPLIKNVDDSLIPKGAVEPGLAVKRSANFSIAFAARPGTIALASSQPGANSVYTAALLKVLNTRDRPFETLHKDVRVAVEIATEGEPEVQSPGLYDSGTEAVLYPGPPTRDQELAVWKAALDSRDSATIRSFVRRHSLNPYVRSARAWLANNGNSATASDFTLASPVAIERAWETATADQRFAVARLSRDFAFSRRVELTEQLDAADAPAIGLLPSGGQMPPGAVPSFEAQTLQDHGFAVVIGEQVARSRPSREAPVAKVFEPLSQLRVTDTVVSDDGLRTWLAVQPADSKGGAPTAFVEVRSARAAPPLELGTPIREFLVPPPTEGLSALVDARVLEARLAETRAEGYTITWVSLSSAATPDETERGRRADRVLHAMYLLKQGGLDGRRITATERTGAEDDPAVRVRLFGHR